MRSSKRFTTAIAVALICALALAIGVLPTIAMVDENDGGATEAFDVADKFPEVRDLSQPRFRSAAEMSLVQISSTSPVASPVVLASDDAQEPVVSTPELEAFRADFITYFTDLQAVAVALGETDWARENPDLYDPCSAGSQVSPEQLAQSLALVGPEELAEAKAVFESDPEWRERPAQLMETVSRGAGEVAPAWSAYSPPWDWDAAIFAARYVALNANIAMEVLQPDITIIIFGAGTSVPNPFRIAAVITWGIAENVVIFNEIQQDNRDDYHVDYLIDHAHQTGERVSAYLDYSVLSVNNRLTVHDTTVSGRFNGVDLALANLETHLVTQDTAIAALETHLGLQDIDRTARLDFVDGEIAAVRAQLTAQDAYMADTRTLMMRMAIEENLLADEPPLATFIVPVAQGGRLEEAKTIVVETIAFMRAAGLSVNNADSELRRGDAAYSGGNYKEAYERYRAAYREAVR